MSDLAEFKVVVWVCTAFFGMLTSIIYVILRPYGVKFLEKIEHRDDIKRFGELTKDRRWVRILYKMYETVLNLFQFSFGIFVLTWIVMGIGFIASMILAHSSHPAIAIAFVFVSILLFGFRTRYPFAYGFVEAMIGISAIWYSVTASPVQITDASKILSIMGGVYIIVRGIDNMDKQVPSLLDKSWRLVRWGIPRRVT